MPQTMKIVKNEKVFEIKDLKKKHLACKIDRQKKRGSYFLLPQSPQYKWARRFTLAGFDVLPSGLKSNGAGFPSRGYLLLRFLAEKFTKFELIISADGKSGSAKSNGVYRVTLHHDDLRRLLQGLRRIAKRNYEEQRDTVLEILSECFSTHFKQPKRDSRKYESGELAALLEKRQLFDNLAKADIERLGSFFPQFVERYGKSLGKPEKLLAISGQHHVELVYLENVIRKYERRLRGESQNEHSWQRFLGDYILLFNTNYASTLEKESIDLRGKYPDFLMVDAYNYLDIYEIKKPSTNLLRHDKSRGNYYWDTEIAKAFSQVENYIAYAERNDSQLRVHIKQQKNIDVRVMKPRGFIIAGQRKQLKNQIMEENFRLLNGALKNVEVILYDDLLNNLKNFFKRLKKGD